MRKVFKKQRKIGDLYEMTEKAVKTVEKGKYYNEDLAATSISKRTWDVKNITALWVGMCVCIPAYMLASSLMTAGLNWWQAILNIALANIIVLVPIQLNSHAGTKYGIPFPVFARMSFGIKGANIAALARAITGAGWFGIQAWVGGTAIYTVLSILIPSISTLSGAKAVCFIGFLILNVYITYKGLESVKILETLGAPMLGILVLGLLVWAFQQTSSGGYTLGQVLANEGTYAPGNFWPVFLKGLTANIAFWATLSLNIPDFSRFAKTQKDQFYGQLFGLPLTMTIIAFVGVFVTGTTKVLFGEFIWDPTMVIAKIGSPTMAILGGIGIAIATLTTNVAANGVAAANDITNMAPKKINFKKAIIITGLLGVAICPWKLLASANAYIFGWLDTYALFLGPLAGIFISDYYLFRKRNVDITALYEGKGGRYWYNDGFNYKAILTWIIAGTPALLGKLIPALAFFANSGWIIGFLLAIVVYNLIMSKDSKSLVSNKEMDLLTEDTNVERKERILKEVVLDE